MVNQFTPKEDSYLVQYIGKYNPEPKGRSGNDLYKTLVANEKALWPWAKTHSWESWRGRYVTHKEEFDRRIRAWQAKQPKQQVAVADPFASLASTARTAPSSQSGRQRHKFSKPDDLHLVQYLAIECPNGEDRKGIKVYNKLYANPERWPWAGEHTAQSWRERYVKRPAQFDKWIENYQERYGIEQTKLPHPELWNALPRIGPDDILSPGEAGQAPPSSQINSTARRSLNNASRSAKTPLKRIREEDSESEREVVSKPRKRGLASRKEIDGETDRRKRRRLEKQKAREESESEEEAEGDTPRAAERPSDVGQMAASPVGRSQVNTQQPEAKDDVPAISAEDAAKAETLIDRQSELQQAAHDLSLSLSLEPHMDDKEVQDRLANDSQPLHATPQTSQTTVTRDTATKPSQTIPSYTAPRLPMSQTHPLHKVPQEPTPPTSDVATSPQKSVGRRQYRLAEPPMPSSSHRSTMNAIGSQNQIVEDGDEYDAFEIATPVAESSAPRRQGMKRPPVRVEGAFNSAITGAKGTNKVYQGARRRSGVDQLTESEEEPGQPLQAAVWPPKRDRGKGKATASSTIAALGVPPLVPPTHNKAAKGSSSSRSSNPQILHPASANQSSVPRINVEQPSQSTAERIKTAEGRGKTHTNEAQPVAGPSRLVAGPTDTMERRHTLATPAPLRRVSRDAFQPRQSMPTYLGSDLSRRVEVDNIVSNVSFGGRLITAEDHKNFLEIGIRGTLLQLVQASGFSYEVVENVWKACGTIADVKIMLDRMRARAEDVADETYEELRIAEKIKERERSVLQEQLVSPLELSKDASRAFEVSPRPRLSFEEYWPPDDSKAAILLRQRQQAANGNGSKQTVEDTEQEEASDEEEEEEDDDDDDDDEEDDDSRILQLQRILATARADRNK